MLLSGLVHLILFAKKQNENENLILLEPTSQAGIFPEMSPGSVRNAAEAIQPTPVSVKGGKNPQSVPEVIGMAKMGFRTSQEVEESPKVCFAEVRD